ncbi:sensor histidine kinase [Burkholderia alba]|uniref:sensor histidine kinase n=1 Tax=Burkholderia alba TaxID=2683677 RepID=UPI002B056B04|nr:ATP-binding protein [Burkholderia alba]
MDTPFSAPPGANSLLSPAQSIADDTIALHPAPARVTAGFEARIARLAAELVTADESARRHLAGELHDGLGANLTAARFALANVDTWLPADVPEGCRRALALAQQALDAATDANRRLIAEQDTPGLDAGLVATLSDWIGAYAARTGLRTSFICVADARVAHLGADGALAVFRVAQEALANIAKHARAHAADVRIEADDTHLVLVVADDGIGLTPTDRRGYGLGGMRARCEAFGGTLDLARSRAGRGTTLRARFGWAALAPAAPVAPRSISHS